MKLRNILKAAALAAVAAAPASGEAAPGSATKPDFSGLWAHPWLPGFEALSSGPTALVNLARTKEGRSIQTQLVGDYKNPILKPEAAETVRKLGEQSKSHFGFHNPRNQCWPNGLPFVLSSNGQQIFDRGDHLTMIYRVDHQLRTVRMNASHPANITPSYYGDSVGHYEGDTLVIDTIGIKPGPFAMIDWFGTPQTPALHVVERYRLIDNDQVKDGVQRANKDNVLPQFNNPPVVDFNSRGKWLQLLFTVDDPNVFTTPWSATVTFGPAVQSAALGANAWPEDVCAENPHKYGTEEDVQLPTARVADF
jgi:hypothetical protein